MNRYIFLLLIFPMALLSCGDKNDGKEENLLARVKDKTLTVDDVRKDVPVGLSQEDSLLFVKDYIDNWIDRQLLQSVANKNIPSMEQIDKMVEDYRNQLIMQEYRKEMLLSRKDLYDITEDSIKKFYDINVNKFILQTPILRGIYVRIPEKAPQLEQVKKWVKSGNVADVEKIEKYGAKIVIQYDYFKDRWVSFQEIEKNIPLVLDDANSFVKSNKSLEVSRNGFVYLLNISDYKLAGEIMPYDFAKQRIRELYINANQKAFDKKLRFQLREEALESGDLVMKKN